MGTRSKGGPWQRESRCPAAQAVDEQGPGVGRQSVLGKRQDRQHLESHPLSTCREEAAQHVGERVSANPAGRTWSCIQHRHQIPGMNKIVGAACFDVAEQRGCQGIMEPRAQHLGNEGRALRLMHDEFVQRCTEPLGLAFDRPSGEYVGTGFQVVAQAG